LVCLSRCRRKGEFPKRENFHGNFHGSVIIVEAVHGRAGAFAVDCIRAKRRRIGRWFHRRRFERNVRGDGFVDAGVGGGAAADPGASLGVKGAGTSGTDASNAARGGNPATPGTNALGTANSSGEPSGTVGMAGGNGAGGTSAGAGLGTGDPMVDSQDRAVDKKIKSICKGC
jgi:hypothetical protein